MSNDTIALDREGWLTEAAGFILDDLIMPHAGTHERPPFRVSVGFPSGRRSRKQIAVCLKRRVSADGVNEIFVSPTMDDSIEILAALVHELVHAVDDCASGHRGFFAHVARAVGLTGPLTATTAGPMLSTRLQSYVELLGAIPHAKVQLSALPQQRNRQLKCVCINCGFTFRTTRTWIARIPADPQCIICDGTIQLDV